MLKQLRKDDYSPKMKELVKLDPSLTTRDRDGITKPFRFNEDCLSAW